MNNRWVRTLPLAFTMLIVSLISACDSPGMTHPATVSPSATVSTRESCEGDGCEEPEDMAYCPGGCPTFETPTSIPDGVDLQNVAYAVVDGKTLTLDIYRPEVTQKPFPAVITIHGGAFTAGVKIDHSRIAEEITKWGYAVIPINYRLAPQDPFPAAVEDVLGAVAWVRENAGDYDIDPDKLALLGTSAGGHLAALTALATATSALPGAWQPSYDGSITDFSVQAYVSCFGPVDLAYHAGESQEGDQVVTAFLGQPCLQNPSLCKQANPLTYVTAGAPRGLLTHGTADEVVGIENSERLHKALQSVGAESTFVPVKGAGHSFVLRIQSPYAQIALAAIHDFLEDAFE